MASRSVQDHGGLASHKPHVKAGNAVENPPSGRIRDPPATAEREPDDSTAAGRSAHEDNAPARPNSDEILKEIKKES